ncbi:TetR/AcrR family transcriptional regulator [Actinocorallia aurea]
MTGPPEESTLRADARRNRDSLLAVARQVIAEEGTDASLRSVARRAGVGIGTLYRHFPTREALLEAVVGDGFDALRALADRLLAEEPSPRAALATWLRRFSANSGACRGLSGSVLSGLNDPASELHVSAEAMHLAATRLLTRAQEAGEVRAGITAADVITMSAAAGWVAQISGEEQSRRMLDVITDGLAPAPEA